MNKDMHAQVSQTHFLQFLYSLLIEKRGLMLMLSNALLVWLLANSTKCFVWIIGILLNTLQVATKSFELQSKLCTLALTIFLTEFCPSQIA